jgi:hypothetical protein
VVEVHAAEALLIVDGHSHLFKDDQSQMQQRYVAPGRITVTVSKMRGLNARSRRKECQVWPSEFAGFGETISFVLTGGISVLMCLSVGKTKAGSRSLVGHPEGLEVVTSVNDCDSSDREWRKG